MNIAVGTLLMCHLLVVQPDGTKIDKKVIGTLFDKKVVTQYVNDSVNEETYTDTKEVYYVEGTHDDKKEFFIKVSKNACRPVISKDEREKREKARQALIAQKEAEKEAERERLRKVMEENKKIRKENKDKAIPQNAGIIGDGELAKEVQKEYESTAPINPIKFKEEVLENIDNSLKEIEKEAESKDMTRGDLIKEKLIKKVDESEMMNQLVPSITDPVDLEENINKEPEEEKIKEESSDSIDQELEDLGL